MLHMACMWRSDGGQWPDSLAVSASVAQSASSTCNYVWATPLWATLRR